MSRSALDDIIIKPDGKHMRFSRELYLEMTIDDYLSQGREGEVRVKACSFELFFEVVCCVVSVGKCYFH